MVYDEDLAGRIRYALRDEAAVSERRMFGGCAFLLGGRMAVCASGRGGLMVRVDPRQSDELVARPHVERMVMKGRPMAGWLLVDVDAGEPDELDVWVGIGSTYVTTLPAT